MIAIRQKKYFHLMLIAFCTTCISSSPVTAALATPVATPNPIDVPLIDIIFESAPKAPAFIGVARMRFPPGGIVLGGQIAGPRMFLIESGAIVVALNEPATIRHADGTHTVAPAEIEFPLNTGDLLILTDQPPQYLGAAPDTPASLIDIVIWPQIGAAVRALTTETGVTFEPLVVGEAKTMPASSLRVRLQQLPVRRQQDLQLGAIGGPGLLVVESGRAGLTASAGIASYAPSASNNPGSVLGQPRQLPIAKEAALTAGGNAFLQAGATLNVRNIGRNTLELIYLEVVPAS